MKRRGLAVLGMAALILAMWPAPAAAYVGPGAGLTILGAALALVASVVLGVVGFVWYPVKRLIRALRGDKEPAQPPAS